MNKKHKLKQQTLSKRRLFFYKAIITIFTCTLGTGLLWVAVEGIITGEMTVPSGRYETDIIYFAINPFSFLYWLGFCSLSGIFSLLIPFLWMDSILPVQKDNGEKFKNAKKNKKKQRRALLKNTKN